MPEVREFRTTVAGRDLIIETGRMAHQADASCTVRYGDTMVLVTAVMNKDLGQSRGYFPLMVEYEEKLYAAGKIKGSRWIKREGRPTDDAMLTARMIDRAIRPLFPSELLNDVQVIVTVLSYDGANKPDVLGLIGASIVLQLSMIPWNGPIAGVRMGRVNNQWIVNPTTEELSQSDCNIIVAGDGQRVIMLEAEAKDVADADFYQAIAESLAPTQVVVNFIRDIQNQIGQEKTSIAALYPQPADFDQQQAVRQMVAAWAAGRVEDRMFAKTLDTKSSRKKIKAELTSEMIAEFKANPEFDKTYVDLAKNTLELLVYQAVTQGILKSDRRVDGRGITQIRPLTSDVGLLPRTHGSGLFSRGETQILSVVTLGAPGDQQLLDGLETIGEEKKRYMHHYNFPPFSVGEAKPARSAGRREIGHGALAEKALEPLLPSEADFPYTIRVVSETLGSNGSSSMGSTCGSTLALLDAGVPLRKPVAGIAMGLASDDTGAMKVITDLQDLEDGPGGMDFKITGTNNGITALQLDTKTAGLPMPIVQQAFTQGRQALNEVLQVIAQAIAAPRPELSQYAPRIITVQINPDKIREVIGPGGKVINEIIAVTNCQIDIEQDGRVMITSVDAAMGAKAKEWVENIVAEAEVGKEYVGPVSRLMDFGAFIDILPGKSGMVHISEIADFRVENIGSVLKVGDVVHVRVKEIDSMGRVNLTMKGVEGNNIVQPADGGAPAPSGERGGFGRSGSERRGFGGGDRRGPRPPRRP